MPNPRIGTIKCPIIGDVAEVRKDKNHKLYYVGLAGIISPKSAVGQARLKELTTFDEKPITTDISETEPEHEPNATAKNWVDELLGGWGGSDD
ncbi:hypothetical protein G6Z92_04795 [Vibrio aestuarianus subsp. cardii]|uniref:hypothetical protein n=1 Tax=Vibrio aestuarianus TaxID=28171 RepID=UPI0015C56AD4|nr:hypothetical protein [Vibrio aestuarianus]NGZ66305.1 hypothetical protein [Vibrio aestuarianus subsp. cardii]